MIRQDSYIFSVDSIFIHFSSLVSAPSMKPTQNASIQAAVFPLRRPDSILVSENLIKLIDNHFDTLTTMQYFIEGKSQLSSFCYYCYFVWELHPLHPTKDIATIFLLECQTLLSAIMMVKFVYRLDWVIWCPDV